MDIYTITKTISVLIRSRSKQHDYALLECGAAGQEEHLVVSRSDEDLRGRALTLCAFQIGLCKDLPEFGKGTDVDLGLLPKQAYGCKPSKEQHRLLYDVRGTPGNFGCALVKYDSQVVGMHVRAVTTRPTGASQLAVALLRHVFT